MTTKDFLNFEPVFKDFSNHIDSFLQVIRNPESLPVCDDRARYPSSESLELPNVPTNISEVIDGLKLRLFNGGYCNGAHPGYFGYFHSRSLPTAILGDCVAAVLNQSPAAWRMGPVAAEIELETLSWLADFVGYRPLGGKYVSGIFTTGGSSANLTALKLARDNAIGLSCRLEGVYDPHKFGVYASEESHYSVSRALDIIGLGRNSFRSITTDSTGRIVVSELSRQIREDIVRGITPVAIVGLAGTTSSGHVDPLNDLADIANLYNIWFHIDGAAAGVYAGLSEFSYQFEGLSRADSLTIDPHKWMFVPYGLGCLLVRDTALLSHSFSDSASYWKSDDREDFVFRGIDGARSWKSLGLWIAFQCMGRNGYSDLLKRNLSVCNYFLMKINESPGYIALEPSGFPICCFRIDSQSPNFENNEQTLAICDLINFGNRFFLTTCKISGVNYIRLAVNNYKTSYEHIDELLLALEEARSAVLGT